MVALAGEGSVVDAASVLLLRDGSTGLETFVVLRPPTASSFAGLVVFPGGQVDAADAAAEAIARCRHLTPAEAARRLAPLEPPERALAQFVAGVRELFEEAGVLLAQSGTAWVDPARLRTPLPLLRAALHAGRTDLPRLCADESLDLAVGALVYCAHWITPVGNPKRFDTRFFLAELPPGQEASHDGRETHDGEWIAPGAVLEQYRCGTAQLAPPTFVLLSELARARSVGEALAAARGRRVTTILPRAFPHPGGPAFLYPGDVAYDGGDPDRPGPRRRLVTQDGRFLEIVAD